MEFKNSMVYVIGENEHGDFGNNNTEILRELTPLKWCENMEIIDIVNGYGFTIYKDNKNNFYVSGNNEMGSCMIDEKKEDL